MLLENYSIGDLNAIVMTECEIKFKLGLLLRGEQRRGGGHTTRKNVFLTEVRHSYVQGDHGGLAQTLNVQWAHVTS